MIDRVAWLALEVKDIEAALAFYCDTLELPVTSDVDGEVALAAGPTEIRLREPGPVPRGGLHVHYAFSTPTAVYDRWWERLTVDHDLHEERFGAARSLYCYDPEGNCVEIGETDTAGDGLTGVFEVVLEVEDLGTAEAFWGVLADRVADRGEERRRVRLDLGPIDVELWEPQLGIADARGGVHVDLGVAVTEPRSAATDLESVATSVAEIDDTVRVRDPDGHYLTLRPAAA